VGGVEHQISPTSRQEVGQAGFCETTDQHSEGLLHSAKEVRFPLFGRHRGADRKTGVDESAG
jgi:hypothetical protein